MSCVNEWQNTGLPREMLPPSALDFLCVGVHACSCVGDREDEATPSVSQKAAVQKHQVTHKLFPFALGLHGLSITKCQPKRCPKKIHPLTFIRCYCVPGAVLSNLDAELVESLQCFY